jgi:hypothetical protein
MSFDKQNYWRCILQSEIRNLATAESEGRQKTPSNPLHFCRTSPEAFQFGARSVLSVLFKKGSDFVKQTRHNEIFGYFTD